MRRMPRKARWRAGPRALRAGATSERLNFAWRSSIPPIFFARSPAAGHESVLGTRLLRRSASRNDAVGCHCEQSEAISLEFWVLYRRLLLRRCEELVSRGAALASAALPPAHALHLPS